MSKGGGGSTSTVQQKSDPWKAQQPYLTFGFDQAKDLYNTQGPNYFPNSTSVPFAPQTETALGLTEGRALQGSPLNFNAQGLVNDTLQGGYLGGNPYLDAVYDRGASAMTRNFSEGVMPGIDSAFAGAGRYGSDLWSNQRDNAYDQLGRSLEGYATNLYGNDYANERNRQMQAAGMAPQLANQDYADFQQLANVGGIIEGKAGENLQDQMARYSYYQQLPEQKLRDFMQTIQGNYGGTSSQQTTTPTNPLSTGLGLGMMVSSLFGGAGAAATPNMLMMQSAMNPAFSALGGFTAPSLAGLAGAGTAAAGAGMTAASLPFFMCHVAREVFGEDNFKWLKFYFWKEYFSPKWFKKLYNKYSKEVAYFISDKPLIKSIIRTWMEDKIHA